MDRSETTHVRECPWSSRARRRGERSPPERSAERGSYAARACRDVVPSVGGVDAAGVNEISIALTIKTSSKRPTSMNLAIASLHLNCSSNISPKSLFTKEDVAETLSSCCRAASGRAGRSTGAR
jgi:hypothetical protein